MRWKQIGAVKKEIEAKKEDLSFDKYNLWHLDGQQC